MSDAGEELNQIAVELERHALLLPRPLAAMVLAVAAARIAGDAPAAERKQIAAQHPAAATGQWRTSPPASGRTGQVAEDGFQGRNADHPRPRW